jgi:hypothetical protein
MQLGNLQLTSWVDVGLPEVVWLAVMHERLGLKRGVEVALQVTRTVDTVTKVYVALTSEFDKISADQATAIRTALPPDIRADVVNSLQPFVTLYPESSLSFLAESASSSPVSEILSWFKPLLADLMDRTSRASTLAQGSLIYLILLQGRLQVGRGSSLSQIADIEAYPETAESRRVASSVRASLNMYFSRQSGETMAWPRYFWNRGFELEPCYFESERRHAGE